MLVLAVDTATESCSVAICQDHNLVAETTLTRKETHSRHLLGIIDETLRRAKLDLKCIDGFAVTRGPGSFTGLRIGMSTIKGLAFALGKPVVGVSSLQALAVPLAPMAKRIVAMIDARRGEVYAAGYRSDGQTVFLEGTEQVGNVRELINEDGAATVFVGSGAIKYQAQIESLTGKSARFTGSDHHVIRGFAVSQLGLEELRQTGGTAAGDLLPAYVRLSDAQLKLGPAVQNGLTNG